METRYLCSSWQGFIQMLVYLFGRDYYYYCLVNLPELKKHRWEKIDQKLIFKYQAAKSKWQRYKAKEQKRANFYYLRWNSVAIIMHTKGHIPEEINYDDLFQDIRKMQLEFYISELVGFVVYLDEQEKVSVKLTKDTYAGHKTELTDAAATKNIIKMQQTFNMLNGYPAWKGIIQQKRKLSKYLVRQAQKHQITLYMKSLRLVDKRFPVKVFS